MGQTLPPSCNSLRQALLREESVPNPMTVMEAKCLGTRNVKGARCHFSNSGKLWPPFSYLSHAGGIIIRQTEN